MVSLWQRQWKVNPNVRLASVAGLARAHPTLYTPGLASRLAAHIAAGLTDEEAAALEGISCDCISRWRKSNHEFCVAVKKAEAQRLLLRLEHIEAGEQGWQGTAWALERIYPHRFAMPEVMKWSCTMIVPLLVN
jgi:hypothetical protein